MYDLDTLNNYFPLSSCSGERSEILSYQGQLRTAPKNMVIKKSLEDGNGGKAVLPSVDTLNSLQITTGIQGKPYSYAQLITYAIATSSSQKMTLSELYKWCIDNFPYFKETPNQGWKNSIRHNLSLNRNFIRIPRPINEPGKGSYWTLNRAVLKNGADASNRLKNYRHYNAFSKKNGFNQFIKLSTDNNLLYQHPTQLSYHPQENINMSQSSINNFNLQMASSPDMQKVLHSHLFEYYPTFYNHPVSASSSMRPYNMPLYNSVLQENTQYSLDSSYYHQSNKAQEGLLFDILQYQQFELHHANKTKLSPNKDSLVTQSIFLHQSSF
ncbi:hypothetical protein T552_00225 [Pneumocystis carinii B80]|uniref:Fork-head domain-containing protein n=1 Tax=Pneumocystis carinii (strain B80) TaxID=1408658 RepID=A0A0W4ZT91_PNEC8|nr:hypothetical protein T552_00225 [Pneumocystis carinii B80]KTW31587.1 hypothetical protein T552_00225 [Pneumocystis carinii B80]